MGGMSICFFLRHTTSRISSITMRSPSNLAMTSLSTKSSAGERTTFPSTGHTQRKLSTRSSYKLFRTRVFSEKPVVSVSVTVRICIVAGVVAVLTPVIVSMKTQSLLVLLAVFVTLIGGIPTAVQLSTSVMNILNVASVLTRVGVAGVV
eukprot:Rmarinus@m.21190